MVSETDVTAEEGLSEEVTFELRLAMAKWGDRIIPGRGDRKRKGD